MHFNISQRAQRLTSSAIRDLLKVADDPSVISFAGGTPSPLTFQVSLMKEACASILGATPHAALQYAPTEGYMPLREWIAERHRVTVDRVLITTGSQQALDLLAKVLIDPGSRVLVENPTYLGALQAFSLFEPELVPIACDDDGIVPEALTADAIHGARFIYAMPNFQNPTGRRLSESRRRQLAAAMAAVVVIEDDPYGELAYAGESLPTMLSMNPDGVVYLGSFSKIVAPGLRVGYAIAPAPLMNKLAQAKQAADLHTAGFTQRMVYEALSTGFLDAHIKQIREIYMAQRDAMLTSLTSHCQSLMSWNVPEGGMFLWARVPEVVDATRLLEASLAPASGPRVAFVPGAPFYAGAADIHTLRLSFATVPPPRIEEGVAQLASVLAGLL